MTSLAWDASLAGLLIMITSGLFADVRAGQMRQWRVWGFYLLAYGAIASAILFDFYYEMGPIRP